MKKDLKTIKLGLIYTDGDNLYKTIGWIGSSVVVAKAQPYVKWVDSFVGDVIDYKVSFFMKTITLNKFSKTMKRPTKSFIKEQMYYE